MAAQHACFGCEGEGITSVFIEFACCCILFCARISINSCLRVDNTHQSTGNLTCDSTCLQETIDAKCGVLARQMTYANQTTGYAIGSDDITIVCTYLELEGTCSILECTKDTTNFVQTCDFSIVGRTDDTECLIVLEGATYNTTDTLTTTCDFAIVDTFFHTEDIVATCCACVTNNTTHTACACDSAIVDTFRNERNDRCAGVARVEIRQNTACGAKGVRNRYVIGTVFNIYQTTTVTIAHDTSSIAIPACNGDSTVICAVGNVEFVEHHAFYINTENTAGRSVVGGDMDDSVVGAVINFDHANDGVFGLVITPQNTCYSSVARGRGLLDGTGYGTVFDGDVAFAFSCDTTCVVTSEVAVNDIYMRYHCAIKQLVSNYTIFVCVGGTNDVSACDLEILHSTGDFREEGCGETLDGMTITIEDNAGRKSNRCPAFQFEINDDGIQTRCSLCQSSELRLVTDGCAFICFIFAEYLVLSVDNHIRGDACECFIPTLEGIAFYFRGSGRCGRFAFFYHFFFEDRTIDAFEDNEVYFYIFGGNNKVGCYFIKCFIPAFEYMTCEVGGRCCGSLAFFNRFGLDSSTIVANKGNGVEFNIVCIHGCVCCDIVKRFIPALEGVAVFVCVGGGYSCFAIIYHLCGEDCVAIFEDNGIFIIFGIECGDGDVVGNIVKCFVPTCEGIVEFSRSFGRCGCFAIDNFFYLDDGAIMREEGDGVGFHIGSIHSEFACDVIKCFIPFYEFVAIFVGVRCNSSFAFVHHLAGHDCVAIFEGNGVFVMFFIFGCDSEIALHFYKGNIPANEIVMRSVGCFGSCCRRTVFYHFCFQSGTIMTYEGDGEELEIFGINNGVSCDIIKCSIPTLEVEAFFFGFGGCGSRFAFINHLCGEHFVAILEDNGVFVVFFILGCDGEVGFYFIKSSIPANEIVMCSVGCCGRSGRGAIFYHFCFQNGTIMAHEGDGEQFEINGLNVGVSFDTIK